MNTFELICSGSGITNEIASLINDKYPDLENADFEGFDKRKGGPKEENEEHVSFEVLECRIKGKNYFPFLFVEQ